MSTFTDVFPILGYRSSQFWVTDHRLLETFTASGFRIFPVPFATWRLMKALSGQNWWENIITVLLVRDSGCRALPVELRVSLSSEFAFHAVQSKLTRFLCSEQIRRHGTQLRKWAWALNIVVLTILPCFCRLILWVSSLLCHLKTSSAPILCWSHFCRRKFDPLFVTSLPQLLSYANLEDYATRCLGLGSGVDRRTDSFWVGMWKNSWSQRTRPFRRLWSLSSN